MDEKKRTRLLAGLLIATVAVYGGRSMVSSIFLEPINKAELKKSSSEKTLEGLLAKELELRRARGDLQDWRSISLPEDSLNAQRLYREWIENLALKCGFTLQSVEPAGKNDQKGQYLTVAVELKGETDLAGISRFMYLFDQSAMLHRISSLKLSSTGTQGNPRLEVALTAEGMSVFSSGTRNELFSRTGLSESITESTDAIQVKSMEQFPDAEKESFLVRIDRELLKVSALEAGKWKVERALYGTKAAAHNQNAVVELLPVRWDVREKTLDLYQPLLAASPFALPTPPKTWSPRIAGLSDRTIRPGEEIRMTAKADGFNPDLGAPQFTLVEAADGIQLNETTGELVWNTPTDLAAGKYSAKVVMTQPQTPDSKVESTVSVTVRIPNDAPVVQAPDSAIVILGQQFSLPITATDDGPKDQLTFSLGTGAQEGLTIDPKTGVLSWTPPNTFKPGTYNLELKVTDSGTEAKSASKSITLDVRDDSALLTLLTGAVSKDDVWFAWFRNKGSGEQLELKIGDRLKVAEIDAEVTAIEPRSILIKDVQGVWRVNLGESIRQRVLVEPATPATPADASPAEPAAAAAPEVPESTAMPTSLPGNADDSLKSATDVTVSED